MKDVGDIKKVYQAAELLEGFCSKTACMECPIVKLCNKVSSKEPLGRAIMEEIRN